MFRKFLVQDLKKYFHRLWPFAVALIIVTAIATIIMELDGNSVERNGSALGIGLFVIAAVAFFVAGIFVVLWVYFKSLQEKVSSIKGLVGAKFLAAMITVFAGVLLILACVSPFAWQWLGEQFSALLDSNGIYLIELIAFLVITIPYIYLFPVVIMTVFACSRRLLYKGLAVAFGAICGIALILLLVWEIPLLIHSPSSNMIALWISVGVLLVFCLASDIASYILICRLRKKDFEREIKS